MARFLPIVAAEVGPEIAKLCGTDEQETIGWIRRELKRNPPVLTPRGNDAAKKLVDRGLKPGELAIVSSDDTLPYERPPLSKGYLAREQDLKSIRINDGACYENHGIEVRHNTPVRAVDLKDWTLETASGEALSFKKLVIATGAYAPPFPGSSTDSEGPLLSAFRCRLEPDPGPRTRRPPGRRDRRVDSWLSGATGLYL